MDCENGCAIGLFFASMYSWKTFLFRLSMPSSSQHSVKNSGVKNFVLEDFSFTRKPTWRTHFAQIKAMRFCERRNNPLFMISYVSYVRSVIGRNAVSLAWSYITKSGPLSMECGKKMSDYDEEEFLLRNERLRPQAGSPDSGHMDSKKRRHT